MSGPDNLLLSIRALTLLKAQLVAHGFVTAGVWWVCGRLGGRVAAILGTAWWLLMPSAWLAVTTPFYYYWPNVFTVGLAALWLWAGERTWLTLPFLVMWAQFRMTAIGTFTAMPRIGLGIAAWVLTAGLVMMGHGRSQVWHDLLIGIGTRPNPYGIVHRDQWAIDFAAERGVGFKVEGYEAVLRTEYLRIATSNPGLIARNTVLNTLDAMRGWSFFGWRFWAWVPAIILWTAWRDRGVYRRLTLVWLAQCATLGFVGRPQESYLWETLGLFVVLGAVGLVRTFPLTAGVVERTLWSRWGKSPIGG